MACSYSFCTIVVILEVRLLRVGNSTKDFLLLVCFFLREEGANQYVFWRSDFPAVTTVVLSQVYPMKICWVCKCSNPWDGVRALVSILYCMFDRRLRSPYSSWFFCIVLVLPFTASVCVWKLSFLSNFIPSYLVVAVIFKVVADNTDIAGVDEITPVTHETWTTSSGIAFYFLKAIESMGTKSRMVS